jgi:hypothetical protein
MTSEEKELRKQNHGRGMRLLAALTIEHGLRFLSPENESRRMIEEDIAIVRSGNDFEIRSQYSKAKRRKVSHSPEGLLLRGATEMLYVAKHRGNVRHGLLRNVIYCPGETAFLIDEKRGNGSQEQKAEQDWQESVIDPLCHRLFEDYGVQTVPDEIERLTLKM